MNIEVNNINSNAIIHKLNEDNIEIYLDVFKVILTMKINTKISDVVEYLNLGNNSIDKIIFFNMISKIILNKNGRNLVKEITNLLKPIIPIIAVKIEKNKLKRITNKMSARNRVDLKYLIKFLDKSESNIIINLEHKRDKLKLINITLFSNEFTYRSNKKQNLENKKFKKEQNLFQKKVNKFTKYLGNNNNNNNNINNFNNFENISREKLIQKILIYYKKIFPTNRQNIFNNKLKTLEIMTYEELIGLSNSINLNEQRNKQRIKKEMKQATNERNIQDVFNELNISTSTA